MVKAVDYTSKGDDEDIEIMIGDSKKSMIKKKFLTDVIREGKELNEYGVYNSENDVNNNVKTKENEPSDTQAFISGLVDRVKGMAGELAELKSSVEENSKLSFDSLDICIAELQTYAKSLEEENEIIASSNT